MNSRSFTSGFLISNFLFLILFSSCSIQKKISKTARQQVLKDSSLLTAHVGISIYEPESGKYWYEYQGDKYFVPASNTKIPTCYAAMKYLGDRLVGARLLIEDSSIVIYPNADPTFLHPDFSQQPLFQYIKKFKNVFIKSDNWESDAFGSGWSWNDFNQAYMAERSFFPIYGNVINFSLKNNTIYSTCRIINIKSEENFESEIRFEESKKRVSSTKFNIERISEENTFIIRDSKSNFSSRAIPFKANQKFIYELLIDTLGINRGNIFRTDPAKNNLPKLVTVFSQPTDTLLKIMMHRSDNFFAEQSLLMVSNEILGVMNDDKIIDSILKSDFKDLPQKPRWADGSGLSRYNLFSPQDFVSILGKMKNEFGMERIRHILPTGGEGTISNYYKADSGFIFAKTGTLSGVVAFSGYLYTNKGKLLIFSTLVNNHQASSVAVRRAMEKFLQGIRNKY